MRKSIAVLLAVTLFAGVLTGCGSTANDKAADDNAANDNAANDNTASDSAADDNAADAGTVDDSAVYLKDIKVDQVVTLGEYKGLEISLPDVTITDADVESTITNILSSYPMDVDGAVKDGNRVNIDFVGKKGGVEFEGGAGTDQTLVIGSNTYISDLEQGMIGMKKGEVKDVPVTFPEDYHSEDLAGQPAVFTVTMNNIQAYSDQLTDQYVSWLTTGEQTNTADFRKYLKEDLLRDAQSRHDMEKANLIADAVVEKCKFKKIPDGLLQRFKSGISNNIATYASTNGMDVQTYLLYSQVISGDQTPEEYIDQQAEMNAKHYLAYQAIADIENLTVSDSEVSEGIAEMAEQAGGTAEVYEANMDKEGYKEYLLYQKVSKFLEQYTVVNSK